MVMLPELLAVSEGTACPGRASCGHLLGLVMPLGMASSLFSSFLFFFPDVLWQKIKEVKYFPSPEPLF